MKARTSCRTCAAPDRERIESALATLAEADRLALSLRLLEGLSTLETAGAMRVKVSEVEKRLASALRVLSHELGVRPRLRRAA